MEESNAQTGYELFLRIAKNLVLQLPLEKNRVLAAKWIRKIDAIMDMDFTDKSKLLKLIMISMQSKVLVGPFKLAPQPENFDATMIYSLKPVDIKEMIVHELETVKFGTQPYHAEISGDLKEYVVYQEIPDFGSHFYYACSLDEISQWKNYHGTIVPYGSVESKILVPPNPEISKTKEEFMDTYKLYRDELTGGVCDDPCGPQLLQEAIDQKVITMDEIKHMGDDGCYIPNPHAVCLTRPKKPKVKEPECILKPKKGTCAPPTSSFSDRDIRHPPSPKKHSTPQQKRRSADCDPCRSQGHTPRSVKSWENSAIAPSDNNVCPAATDGADSLEMVFGACDTIDCQTGGDVNFPPPKTSGRPKVRKTKRQKVRELACEYLTAGVVQDEREAICKATEFLCRVGCI